MHSLSPFEVYSYVMFIFSGKDNELVSKNQNN
nr:MAG TPA: hypothetical protein [Caudoviricetes sp.]